MSEKQRQLVLASHHGSIENLFLLTINQDKVAHCLSQPVREGMKMGPPSENSTTVFNNNNITSKILYKG